MRRAGVAVWSVWLAGWPALAAAQQGAGPPAPAPESIWDRPTNTILGFLLTLLIGALLGDPLKALVKKLGQAIERGLQRLASRRTRRYLRALGEEHRWLKLIGVSNHASLNPPRLREVYISLRLTASRSEEAVRLGWEQVLTKEEGGRRVVVLGAPGAGKSTLLDYLVLVFTGVIQHQVRGKLGKPLPLFGRLRQLGTEESLPALLARSGPEALPVDVVERRLRAGTCLLLLDGLDEVIDEVQQTRVLDEVNRWAHVSAGNWFVLTCRVAGWQTNWLPGFRVCEVQEFDRDDVRRFIGAWYREVLRTEKANALGVELRPEQLQAAETKAFAEARERSEALWAALGANDGMMRLAGTPLLLSLMTLVHYHQTDLPQERGKLYGQCLEILLELWDKQDKKLKLPDGPSPKEKRLVLQEVAFHFLKDGLVEAGMSDLEAVLAPVRKELQKEIPLDRLIRQIWERSGILVEQAPGRYGFAHRALHDFLAAEHVAAHGYDDLLLAHVAEERWREVILIVVGLVNRTRAERLVRALIEQDGEGGSELEVAGLCLAEDVQLGADLQAEVKERLLARLDREEQGGAFARLAAALRTADLEMACQWMDQQLRQGDSARLRRVVDLVSGLGEEHGLLLAPLLRRLLEDRGAEELVRARAAMVLSRWPSVAADARVWDALRLAREVDSGALRQAASWAWCELGRAGELGFVQVPAGEFLIGSPADEGVTDEYPQHSLYLPTFYMERDPVTVAAYRAYLEQSGRAGDRERIWEPDDHPVTGVDWHDALAYAEWRGCTLPSEAEWEKAARGTDGRRWPWGNEWAEGRANVGKLPRWRRRRGRLGLDMAGATTPVGRFSPAGDSPYGCRDMAGNVWEWTRSLWGEGGGKPSFGYPYQAGDGREDLEASAEMLRVLRGGSCFDPSGRVRCAYRLRYAPDARSGRLGFRVVLLPFSSGL